MSWQEVLSGEKRWSDDCSDCLPWLRSLPDDCVDLVLTSPPYTQARLYLENGKDLGIARDAEEWTTWLVEVCVELRRVCVGLCALVVEGETRDYSYNGAPLLLGADLLRKGFVLRKPLIYRRDGVPGSGGNRFQHEEQGGSADWLKNSYEPILCFTRGGKLPWADALACGHPPKWAPGGAMSNRLSNGSRVNQWGGHPASCSQRTKNGKRQPPGRPSHEYTGGEDEVASGLFGDSAEESVPACKKHTKRRAGKEQSRQSSVNGTTEQQTYTVPAIANPGNVIEELYSSREVAEMLGVQSDVLDCKVGGGQMGSKLAHENEAPFPERLCEVIVRSFCRPGGRVLDCFSGSATTLAVALRLGRCAIGCDLRQSQVDIAHRRLLAETPGLFAE